MKRFTLILITCLLITSFYFGNAEAGESDPYTIYGTVEDGNGNGISGATMTVINEDTGERNTEGKDTVTGNPIPVTTDIDGRYTFELTNLKSSYSYGDRIVVTVKHHDISDSKTVTLIEGNWGSRADITLEVKKDDDDSSSDSPLWIFVFIMVITAMALIFMLYRRQKPTKDQTTTATGAEELPPPPPGWNQRRDINRPTREEGPQPPDDAEPPPPDDEAVHSNPDSGIEMNIAVTSSLWLPVNVSMSILPMILLFLRIDI